MKQKAFSLCCYLLLLFSQVSITDGCEKNTIYIVSSKPGLIICKLATTWSSTDIYWSISGPAAGGKETRIALCDGCPRSSSPCDCNTTDTNYSVTRTYSSDSRSYTTLHFVNNVRDNDKSIIKCSTVDNTSCVELKIIVMEVSTKTGCPIISVDIVDTQPEPSIYCSVAANLSTDIYWSVSGPAGGRTGETRIALCDGCAQSSSPCDCDTTDTNYSVTRTYSSDSRGYTTLHFVNNVRDNDESIIKCSTVDNTSCVELKINVIEDITTNDITTEERSKMSVVLVAGGVGAAVVVIIVVIVAVFVFRRRKGKRGGLPATESHRQNKAVHDNPSGDDYLTPVASHATRQEDQLPYDSLQMSEVGLRSENSDVGSRGNVSLAITGATPYEGLRRSDVGLTSE